MDTTPEEYKFHAPHLAEAEKETKERSQEALDALREMLSQENDEAYRRICQAAAAAFLAECSLDTTPEAVDQLVDGFLPALAIIASRGYEEHGANWRAMGWRGLLQEMGKRWRRMHYNAWQHGQLDSNNAIDLINYTGYYYRLQHAGQPWGDMGEPG